MLVSALALFLCANFILEVGRVITKVTYDVTKDDGGFVALSLYVITIIFAFLFLQHSKPADTNSGYKVISMLTEEERRKETLFVAMVLIGLTFYLMRYTADVIMERMSFFFMFGQMIVLPMAIKRFSKSSRSIINSSLVILSIILFLYRLSTSDLIPYELYFLTGV